jgi:ATP-dependent Clp protease ATP-binding subunit ClpC
LTKNEVKQIADIMLQEVSARLAERAITLKVSDRFKERVVEEGYSPSYGARPLRRAIMRLLEDSLAEAMLSGQIKDGDAATVDVANDGQVRVVKSEQQELLLSSAA